MYDPQCSFYSKLDSLAIDLLFIFKDMIVFQIYGIDDCVLSSSQDIN